MNKLLPECNKKNSKECKHRNKGKQGEQKEGGKNSIKWHRPMKIINNSKMVVILTYQLENLNRFTIEINKFRINPKINQDSSIK